MVDYPTDLNLDNSLDIRIDGANDLATDSGVTQLQQAVVLSVLNESVEFVGESLTGPQLGLLEARIEQAIANNPQVTDPRRVTADSYNRRSGSVQMTVITKENEQFEIGVDT